MRQLSWLLRYGCCCVQSNLEEVLNFRLSKEDYDRISAIDFQLRLVDGIRFLRQEGPYRC